MIIGIVLLRNGGALLSVSFARLQARERLFVVGEVVPYT